MVVTRAEKTYEKHGWKILFAVGILGLVWDGIQFFASQLGYITVGSPGGLWNGGFGSNPTVIPIRFFGYYGIPFFILVVSVSREAYKRGEKWAWYAFLAILIVFSYTLSLQPILGVPSFDISFDSTIVILWILGLLLPFRKFFPRSHD